MGGFSFWHWIILMLFVAVPVGVVGLIVWIIVHVSRRPATTIHGAALVVPAPPPLPVEPCLRQLDDLKAKGLITDAEYERQRSSILGSV